MARLQAPCPHLKVQLSDQRHRDAFAFRRGSGRRSVPGVLGLCRSPPQPSSKSRLDRNYFRQQWRLKTADAPPRSSSTTFAQVHDGVCAAKVRRLKSCLMLIEWAMGLGNMHLLGPWHRALVKLACPCSSRLLKVMELAEVPGGRTRELLQKIEARDGI